MPYGQLASSWRATGPAQPTSARPRAAINKDSYPLSSKIIFEFPEAKVAVTCVPGHDDLVRIWQNRPPELCAQGDPPPTAAIPLPPADHRDKGTYTPGDLARARCMQPTPIKYPESKGRKVDSADVIRMGQRNANFLIMQGPFAETMFRQPGRPARPEALAKDGEKILWDARALYENGRTWANQGIASSPSNGPSPTVKCISIITSIKVLTDHRCCFSNCPLSRSGGGAIFTPTFRT